MDDDGAGTEGELQERREASTGEGSGAAVGGPGGRPCPICERPMTHRHCKYVCPEHGVVYDCSDTFY